MQAIELYIIKFACQKMFVFICYVTLPDILLGFFKGMSCADCWSCGVLEVVDTGDLRTRLDWLRLSAGVEAAPPPMASSPPGGLVRMEDSSGDRMDSLLSNDVEQLLSAEVDMVSLQLLPDWPCKTPPCVPGWWLEERQFTAKKPTRNWTLMIPGVHHFSPINGSLW